MHSDFFAKGIKSRSKRYAACSDVVDSKGFDLPCGAGRLGLKRAPGTFPRALGFESHVSYAEIQRPAHRADLCISGGLEGIRTLDPHNANVVRSQLRYEPKY